MSKAKDAAIRRDIPSISEAVLFRAKTGLFQLQRFTRNSFVDRPARHAKKQSLADKNIIAVSSTPLWTNHDRTESRLIAGKIQNLRVAVGKINGVEIAANEIFSFWKHIGRPSQFRGFVKGRELRQGCIIPTTGGGLCQLSNALYSVALDAGFEIIERHAHTQVIPGSLAEQGRDATVFWNYVDLRFKATKAFRIEAFLTHDALVVQLKSRKISFPVIAQGEKQTSRSVAHNSCASCGIASCFRNDPAQAVAAEFERTAYLVDQYWPEFDKYIQANRKAEDILCIPLDGQQWKKPNYRWNKTGFSEIKRATLATLHRAYDSRKLSAQGANRQKNLLKHDEALAKKLASQLPYEVTHICVSQNLLPFLWREGHLGGRTFDVLMTRLPMSALQENLDIAHKRHPQSSTLNDFRADELLVQAENEALQNATRIITPHSEIGSLFPEKTVLLDWHLPEVATVHKPGSKILFPASTLGRKGAYELREVAKELSLELLVSGKELEGENFWQDVKVNHLQANSFDEVGLVVLPAFVENQPRLLLRALACKIPVIISSACGLQHMDGVITIDAGDPEALANEIRKIMLNQPSKYAA
jgi:hypothetical protein